MFSQTLALAYVIDGLLVTSQLLMDFVYRVELCQLI